MKLYALLIGINLYDKQSLSFITNLDACLNDIKSMRTFLKKHYSENERKLILDDSQILMLRNEEATRENVIKGFREHLCQAQEGDVVLIHYSGHGSFNTTAKEFQEYTTDNQEQTWVLYDSRTEGGLDLADKEIALLLEEIGHNQPHIVVISDSCHSGSVTRDVEDFMNLKVRSCKATNEQRTLESYLDGAYLRRPDLKIPYTKHILLSACDREEKAREGFDEHGVFTKALLDVLNKTGGQLQYSELFVQVRAAIQSFVKNQTPQVEPQFGFSPRQGFLGCLVKEGQFKRYRIRYDNSDNPNTWKIDLGAAMDIQSDLDAPVFINVFGSAVGGTSLGQLQLGYINVTESEIIPKDILANNSQVYWGEPVNFSVTPMFIYGNDEVTVLLKKVFGESVESGVYLHENRDICPFELKIESNNILIYDTLRNIMVQGVEGTNDWSIESVLNILKKLARWHRTLDLQNKKSKLNKDTIDFSIIINPDESNSSTLSDSTITLEYEEGNLIPFKAVFTNKTKTPLYIGLSYLTPQYGIIPFYADTKPIPNGNQSITLYEDTFFLDNGVNEEIDTLKLIVSTNPIDNSVFSLEDLEIGKILKPDFSNTTRSIGKPRNIGRSLPDWLTKTITVRIVRKKPASIGVQAIQLGNGITIQSHSSFTASLNKIPLIPQTRSIDTLPISDLYFRNNPHFSIVNFAEKIRGEDESIFEFSDIQNIESLKTQSLDILIQPHETDDIITLPFIFDGQNFLPFGTTQLTENGQIKCSLSHVPNDIAIAKTRSLGSALRLVFIKFANKIGLGGETHLLRWVDYKDNDKAIRNTSGLEDKVKEANKILLLIHGIIGDTEDMTDTFKFAVDEKCFDLVLTFDYENLNTLIEDNSRILFNTLDKLGFDENDGKELVIVAHSMGGLVARYMIEHLSGDKFVDKLIMAGTPNGGSKFGNIPTYINWASMILGVGTTFFPNAVTGIASTFMKLMSGTILVALEEMKPSSTFIENLKLGKTTDVPYIVLGGNLDSYLKDSTNDRSIMDKIAVQSGEWVYKDESNDIAVGLASIFSVEAQEKRELACHHLNYFTTQEALEAIKKAICQ